MNTEEIYNAAFEDELEKISGIPRVGLGKRMYSLVTSKFNTKNDKVQDVQFTKTKVYKQWTKERRKELRVIKKHWRKQQKLKFA